ncbi:MAG: extracellular solute-binding protein [Treponema sp.]|jgi:multiple sugar transport system substrate-binding protein|nr:extracellular solute-binding protein [Treponema sp.]
MRKITAAALVLLAVMLAITGCSKKEAASGGSSGGSGGTVTLRFWSHQNIPWNDSNEGFIAGFQKENPNIKIEYEAFPYEDFEQKTQTSLLSKSGGADIYELWGGWALDFTSTGALAVVPDKFINELKADSYEPVLAAFNYNGKYYGVPIEFNAEYGGMLVLKPFFDSHNIKYPTTWNEMISIAKANTVSRNNFFDVRGFDFLGADTMTYTYLSMILSKGGNYLEDGGHRFNFDTPIAREALSTLRNYIVVDKITNLDGFTNTEGVEYGVFNGVTLQAPRGMWTIPTGKETYGVELGTDFDYIPSPFYGDQKKWAAETGWGLVVNGGSAHQEEAWKFVEYLLRPENILQNAIDRGNIPPRKSVARDPKYLAAVPFAKPVLDVLEGASFVGYINTDVMKNAIDNAFVDYVEGGASLDATITRINNELNEYAQ